MDDKPSLNLIVWDNGVGLSRDLRLLACALRRAGFEVHLSPIGRGKLRKWLRPLWMRGKLGLKALLGGRARFDANIMLEHVRPEDMRAAHRNFFIPNPEWCLPSDVALLDRVGPLRFVQRSASLFRWKPAVAASRRSASPAKTATTLRSRASAPSSISPGAAATRGRNGCSTCGAGTPSGRT